MSNRLLSSRQEPQSPLFQLSVESNTKDTSSPDMGLLCQATDTALLNSVALVVQSEVSVGLAAPLAAELVALLEVLEPHLPSTFITTRTITVSRTKELWDTAEDNSRSSPTITILLHLHQSTIILHQFTAILRQSVQSTTILLHHLQSTISLLPGRTLLLLPIQFTLQVSVRPITAVAPGINASVFQLPSARPTTSLVASTTTNSIRAAKRPTSPQPKWKETSSS